MFHALRKLWPFGHRAAATAATAAAEPTSWTLRRYEGAEHNRLNSAHWQKVTGQSINVDLMSDLERLRTRAAYEVSNNPTLEGVIHTYKTDVAGRNGPTLQVQSDDEAWNDAAEAVWREFWKNPEISGRLSGVDLLKLAVNGLWVNGEFLWQKVTSRRAVDARLPVAMRLKVIHPRRLATPSTAAAEPDVIMGVRQTAEGEPVEYLIREPRRMGPYLIDTGSDFRRIPAALVMHRFIIVEEDQARGVPWLATPLQAMADLRDYDLQVMDAARQAADQAVFLHTDHPDANYLEVNESVDIERRTVSTLPPGWKPSMLTPTQPMGNYVEFKSEKQRDVGRPIGMPLMMVRLDSSNHNYSSARFDGQIYLRGVQALQAWLERRTLNEMLEDVLREAELYAASNPRWEHAAALRRRPPGRLEFRWTWPVPPHVDPSKESAAEEQGLRNGTVTYPDALAARGQDEDSVIAVRARTNKKLAAAGLPPLPTSADTGQGGSPAPADAAKVQELRDAATAAEEQGDQDTADELNAQADAMEKQGGGGQRGGPGIAGHGDGVQAGPAGLNGAQITAMVDVVSKLKDGTVAPEAAVELLAAGGIPRDAAERIVKATPVLVKDASAEQVAFQRDVVKLFLEDKTVNDVIYNATDIPVLLTSVGLKLDADVARDPNQAIPFLPIVADPGQLVTGDTVKDPQGDIVGGDVEEPPQGGSVEAPADAAGKDKVQQGAGAGDQNKEGGAAKPPAAAAADESKGQAA